MEALILLLIGVIAIPILLIITRSSPKRTQRAPEEPGIRISVRRPGVPQLTCPRCGSPVVLRGDCWECGWCLDSGDLGSLPCAQPHTELQARIICGVDFSQRWTDLKTGLETLVPQEAAALLPSLLQAAVYQISASPLPEDGQIEETRLRAVRAFLDSNKEPGLPEDTAARIWRGEILFEQEGALAEDWFGTFWKSLLVALENEGAIPWDTDTDPFFHALACFASWRCGGPFADPAFLDNKYALQRAFHDRWEALHPEERDGDGKESSQQPS